MRRRSGVLILVVLVALLVLLWFALRVSVIRSSLAGAASSALPYSYLMVIPHRMAVSAWCGLVWNPCGHPDAVARWTELKG